MVARKLTVTVYVEDIDNPDFEIGDTEMDVHIRNFIDDIRDDGFKVLETISKFSKKKFYAG